MTSKERLLCALNREKPDRLPVTIHQWQGFHLDKYMGGISDLQACKQIGFDAQIQYFEEMAQFWVADADFTKMNTKTIDIKIAIFTNVLSINRYNYRTIFNELNSFPRFAWE